MGIKILILVAIFLIPLILIPAYSLVCPDGAYIGRDNQGNEACRDIKTNQIIGHLASPVVAPSNQANQPSSSNQNSTNNSFQGIIDFLPIIIIFIVIIAIIGVASRRTRSSNVTHIPSNYSHHSSKTGSKAANTRGKDDVRKKARISKRAISKSAQKSANIKNVSSDPRKGYGRRRKRKNSNNGYRS